MNVTDICLHISKLILFSNTVSVICVICECHDRKIFDSIINLSSYLVHTIKNISIVLERDINLNMPRTVNVDGTQRRSERRWRPFCTKISCFTLGCVNARSVGNKAAPLCRAIVDERLDILVITETWHEDS